MAFRLVSLFDRKARRGLNGRAGLFLMLEQQLTRLDPSRKRVWFHSSSMGEFEQAKPVIAALKQRHPDIDIIATFFSPSGYEHSRNYKLASVISYIPFDTRRNAQRFITLVRPAAAIIVRYDVWPNHVWQLQRAGVPVFIANATLGADTLRLFPIVKSFHRNLYNAIGHILTVSERDADVFRKFPLSGPLIEAIGDTRYDQVLRRSEEALQRSLIPAAILAGRKTFIIGSSWEEDESVLLPACAQLALTHPELLIIIVPHEPTVESIEDIERHLNMSTTSMSYIRFSNLHDYRNENVIIVDSVGILMALYRYAHVAYVGGGFGRGIHNILEAAVYGVPVVIGPRHEGSQEALQLLRDGGAFTGTSRDDLYTILDRLFSHEAERIASGKIAREFVQKNAGATDRVLSFIEAGL